MLATDTALRGLKASPARLAIFSGALICETHWRSASDRLRESEVVQSHGRYDMILPIQTGRWLNDFFQESCNKVRYHEFDGPHTIPMEAIDMLSRRAGG
jgi:phospholipase/carboxylesterase